MEIPKLPSSRLVGSGVPFEGGGGGGEEGTPPPRRKFAPCLAVGVRKDRAELEAAYGGKREIPVIEFEDEDIAAGWE